MKINNEFTVGVPIGEAWNAMLDLERIAPCLPGASIDEQEDESSYKGSMAVKIGPITAKYKGTVKYEEKDEANHKAVLQATGRDARGQGTASATITSTMEEVSGGTKVMVETDMKLTGKAAQFGRGIAQDVASKMLGQFAECLEERLGGDSEPEAAAASAGNGATGASASPESSSSAASSAANGGAMVTPGGVTPGSSSGSLGAGSESSATSFARPVSSSSGDGSASGGASTASAGSPSGEEKPKASRKISQPDPEPLDLGEMSQDAVMKRVTPVLIGAGVLVVLIWLLRRGRH
ncbi:MAG: SRPBCC family protein [Actinomycetota bacterium]|jgi:carbon monoxide dehydrogenase subunit G|nr:SRPBCC family protein [Rubrobacter sp.]MDQ3506634.1 SRPBCC family protein [Actinomycetota bacterium]